MDPKTTIVLQTFPNTAAASFAASQLSARGIECQVTSDDGGGMYPPFGLVKLMVNADDAQAARECLEPTLPPELPDAVSEAEEPATEPPQFRPLKFRTGLVIGLVLGGLLHFSYTSYQRYSTHSAWYDRDQDGKVDEQIDWKNGHPMEGRRDRNQDGQYDYWWHYSNGLLAHAEGDDNFDGRPDVWITYSRRGSPLTAQYDTDFNGVPDLFLSYTNGVVFQSDLRPNRTNVVLRRQIFKAGVLNEELRDLDGDGWFDISIKFDAFQNPTATNYLRPRSTAP